MENKEAIANEIKRCSKFINNLEYTKSQINKIKSNVELEFSNLTRQSLVQALNDLNTKCTNVEATIEDLKRSLNSLTISIEEQELKEKLELEKAKENKDKN